MPPEMVNTLVDAFFEGKKVQVKQRLRDSLDTIVDDLFGELVGQIKQLLVPIKQDHCKLQNPISNEIIQSESKQLLNAQSQSDLLGTKSSTFPSGNKSVENITVQQNPKLSNMFAVKSVPCTLNQPNGSGVKRWSENQSETTEGIQIQSTPIKRRRTESQDQLSPSSQTKPSSANGSDVPDKVKDSGNRKFACLVAGCGKQFPSSRNLKLHQRGHEGKKPFLCKWSGCRYASENRANTIRHIGQTHLKHSSKTGEKDTQDPKLYLEVNQELLK